MLQVDGSERQAESTLLSGMQLESFEKTLLCICVCVLHVCTCTGAKHRLEDEPRRSQGQSRCGGIRGPYFSLCFASHSHFQ